MVHVAVVAFPVLDLESVKPPMSLPSCAYVKKWQESWENSEHLPRSLLRQSTVSLLEGTCISQQPHLELRVGMMQGPCSYCYNRRMGVGASSRPVPAEVKGKAPSRTSASAQQSAAQEAKTRATILSVQDKQKGVSLTVIL